MNECSSNINVEFELWGFPISAQIICGVCDFQILLRQSLFSCED